MGLLLVLSFCKRNHQGVCTGVGMQLVGLSRTVYGEDCTHSSCRIAIMKLDTHDCHEV